MDMDLERAKELLLERTKELLNALIDNALVGEKSSDVIEHLLHIGFTEQELIEEFGFSENDVAEAIEDIENDED